MTPLYDKVFKALVDDISDIRRFVRCPVSDIAGPEHYFDRTTGRMIDWDVMGDDRARVRVCATCADLVDA